MTRDELKARYPNASLSTLRRNLDPLSREIVAMCEGGANNSADGTHLCCVCGEPITDNVCYASPDLSRRRHAGCKIIKVPQSEGRESKLHDKIISWCREQHPIAPYIHARMDKCSTIGEGVPDFAVCYRGKVILVECKSRDGKLSEAQRNWSHLASLQGCVVHVVRSIEEFLEAVK